MSNDYAISERLFHKAVPEYDVSVVSDRGSLCFRFFEGAAVCPGVRAGSGGCRNRMFAWGRRGSLPGVGNYSSASRAKVFYILESFEYLQVRMNPRVSGGTGGFDASTGAFVP